MSCAFSALCRRYFSRVSKIRSVVLAARAQTKGSVVSVAAQHKAMSTMPLVPLVAPEAWRPPVEFWGCDPVWRSSVKILAAHLARLPWAAEGDVCWLNNHPIRDLDIVGIVVGLDPSQVRVRVRVRVRLGLG